MTGSQGKKLTENEYGEKGEVFLTLVSWEVVGGL